MNVSLRSSTILITLVVLSNVLTLSYAQSKVQMATVGGIEGEWIVVMKNKRRSTFSALSANVLASTASGVQVKGVYSSAINGFHAKMSTKAAMELANNPEVDYIEQNAEVSASMLEDLWGLDRIDQRILPLDHQEFSPENDYDGSGVSAYILDTGINIHHTDFEDRAIWGTNTVDDQDEDCNGHGTHVAGTLGGATFGVAKGVSLVAVKVLGCGGSGTWAGIIEGINWVINDVQSNNKKAVVNMSLGGDGRASVDEAVRNLYNAGIPTVVAAGNENQDACNVSPAREPLAITVGATQSDDQRAGYSNYGTCVDIFAPGSGIKSADYSSNSATSVKNGTSMASPHVAGAVALLLQSGIPVAHVTNELLSRATEDKISFEGPGSSNKMLFVGAIVPTASPTFSPPTSSPTSCSGSALVITVKTDSYPAETSWSLVNEHTGAIELSHEGGYTKAHVEYSHSKCVSSGEEFKFTINDSYGDGICCSEGSGKYTILVDGAIEASGGDFGATESVVFVTTSTDPNPTKTPTNEPTSMPTKVPTALPTQMPTQEPTSLPTFMPTQAPTTLPTFTHTQAPTSDCVPFELSITTDTYPGETTWSLTKGCSNEVVLSGGPYSNANSLYTESRCIPRGAYTFTIKDSYGDGNCCEFGEGKYSLSFDGELVAEGQENFGSEKSWQVGDPSPNTFELTLKTDDYPEETSWMLINRCTGMEELSAPAGSYNEARKEYTISQCVSDADYTFLILDSHGDGHCCGYGAGSYSIKYGGEVKSRPDDSTFDGYSQSTTWGSGSCDVGTKSESKPKAKPPRKLLVNENLSAKPNPNSRRLRGGKSVN